MRNPTLSVLASLLILVTPPASAAQENACAAAATHEQAGDMDQAIEAWQRCLEAGGSADMSPARIHLAIGTAQLASAHIAYAIESFKRAVELEPTLAEAYLARARAHRRSGMKQESLRDSALALQHAERDPLRAEALTHRGDDYARLNLYGRAMADLDRALTLHAHAPAFLSRARLNREMGRTDAALADLDSAIAADATVKAAYRERAELRALTGRHAAAVRDAEQAVRLDSRSADDHAFRCRLLNSLALPGIGLESCLSAARLDRESDRYQLEHAFARWQLEDTDGLRLALGIIPGSGFDAAGQELVGTFPTLLGERMLASLGFRLQKVDGVVDDQTRAALQRFENDHGAPADAAMDTATLDHLRAVLHARISAGEGTLDLVPPEPVLAVTTGPAKGRTITLWELPMTLGRPGGQMARIESAGAGHTVTHAGGSPTPELNGTPLGSEPTALSDGDVLGIFGVEIVFRLP
jgi:tetratricopeptide (TPR) repeat protein